MSSALSIFRHTIAAPSIVPTIFHLSHRGDVPVALVIKTHTQRNNNGLDWKETQTEIALPYVSIQHPKGT